MSHPRVPAWAEGLRLAHVSDAHCRRPRPGARLARRVLEALHAARPHLLCLTGDWMDSRGQEPAARAFLDAVLDANPAPLGAVGVLGNHDSHDLHRALLGGARVATDDRTPPARWIDRAVLDVDARGAGFDGRIRVVGTSWPEDAADAALHPDAPPEPADALTIGLCHQPTGGVGLGAFGVPLILCGHTHGGQVRLSPARVPHRSGDLAADCASGILRIGDSLCCITRGVGEAVLPHLRLNCPRQVACYTLRRGPMPGDDDDDGAGAMRQVVAW